MRRIEDLKEYLIASFPKDNIYLFGSRARGDNSAFSDIDIAIESNESISKKLANVRFEIEESLLPYKVDIVDLSKATYLKNIISKEGIKWH